MREILQRLAVGEITPAEAEKLLRIFALEEVGDLAKLDLGRELRKGIPEIVLAEGKQPQDVVNIAFTMAQRNGQVIVSRASTNHVEAIRGAATDDFILHENEQAQTIVIKKKGVSSEQGGGQVGILTAGTADIPVAEEAKVMATEMGCEVSTAYDVGVAGIHRVLPPLKEMVNADVDALIIVAGREGALPSFVAGLVDIPIIAVPTSIGYGMGEKGIGALTAMLQACPLGLAVVNIDSGIAAGAMAALIANRVAGARALGGQ